MSRRFKVVITDYDYGDIAIEEEILNAAGADVIGLQAKSEDELIEVARDCDAIMNQYARVGSKVISAMTQCKVIARYGVGVDIVDVEAATNRNILVTNVRNYCTEEVADHAISMWLALARNLFAYNTATHEGIWQWQSGAPVYRLRGQTMGIVSFGRIGQAIADRARAFGVNVIVYDPYIDPALALQHQVKLVSKETLVSQSDIFMMQVPMTADTRHFLSEAEFRAMKRRALIINTGRGPTIDNQALYRALCEGWITGAALDDPEEEPAKRAQWNPADNPIFSLPNVIVTPHSAYYSEESIRAARQLAATEVASVLTGKTPRFPVNGEALALRIKGANDHAETV